MADDLVVDLADRHSAISRHPWYEARARLAISLLGGLGVAPPSRVLDAGCGWGVNLAALERSGYNVVGLDVSRRALERLDGPDRQLVVADLTKDLPRDAADFDAVLALDVIEHLDDDRAAVARLAGLTTPGGAAIVSVPAQPQLYSEFDEIQGHRRRYTPDTLERAFAGTGFRVQRVLWWGSWMVPIVRRQRLKRRRAPGMTDVELYRSYLSLPPWPVPLALRAAFWVDHFVSLRVGASTGTSLFALARRE